MNYDDRPDESANGSENATDSIITECDLAEPPEKVWPALTVPDLLAAWLMPNDIRPEVGRRFTFQAKSESGDGAIKCEVLAVEPNRLLRYSWRGGEAERDAGGRTLDTVVTFVLTKTATGGTRLRVIHSGFPLSLRRPVVQLARTVSSMRPHDLRRKPRRTILVANSLRRAA
ncbi:SRPBCC family protein [Rhodospirillaceae bacterium SYSU D60014]|uniref:SRPBCC family protein n=1 Tax=Virgifigura deserti TaxID=2268457 RepID=UPI000E66F645